MRHVFVLWFGEEIFDRIFTSLRILQWATLINKLCDSNENRFLSLSTNESFWNVAHRLKFVANERIDRLKIATEDERQQIDERIQLSSSISYDEDRQMRIKIEDIDDDYLLKSTKETSIRISKDFHLFDKIISLQRIVDGPDTTVVHLFDFQSQYQCESFVILFRTIFPEMKSMKQFFLPLAAAVLNDDKITTEYNENSLDQYLEALMSNIVQQRTSGSREIPLAVLKLQLIGRKQNSVVHLRSTLDNNRDPIFLLYTGARLISILNSFNEKSVRGFYPSQQRFHDELERVLTNKDAIDFLRWIDSFANRFLKIELRGEPNQIRLQIDKIVQEWILFSRRLSPYYSKIRILTENQEHLLQTMFAQLELIERLLDGLRKTFNLLNLSLIERM